MESLGFRYPQAPIAEAVLDVRVAELGESDLGRIATFSDSNYPRREESTFSGAEIASGPLGVTTRTIRRLNGFRLMSEDGRQIVQMRTDGFTFSRLAPYESWDRFYTEARRLWVAYVDLARPSEVVRVAVRYINQIAIPDTLVQVDDYLRTRPEISDDMPTATSGFFLTLDIPLPMFGSTVRITETVLPPAPDARSSSYLVLDIDAFRENAVPSETDDESMAAFDAVFGQLRSAKNLVFEASITDKARELFR